jgi:hypothetical protein
MDDIADAVRMVLGDIERVGGYLVVHQPLQARKDGFAIPHRVQHRSVEGQQFPARSQPNSYEALISLDHSSSSNVIVAVQLAPSSS